jgi:DNA-binding transcriptional ArsR family regulator
MKIVTRLEAEEGHAEAFNALGHLTRLRIFFLLAQAKREVPAGEIQESLGVPGPTLSHHLNLLRLAGLISNRREERHVFYSVNKAMVSQLVRLLTDCC